MAKIPEDPKEIFQEITKDYRDIFKDDLISIMLYGSATGKDYRAGKSDINFMIVLSETGIENLEPAFRIVTKWRKRRVAIPLFLTRGYIETSTDVFPIEYLNFQRNHHLIYGEDILAELSFEKGLIRLQCEREIKGKLLLLRESFLESNGKGMMLKNIISQSIPAFLAIFDALLFLKGRESPTKKRSTIEDTCETYNMDKALFTKLLDIKEQKIKPSDHELKGIFKGYLKEIRSLAKKVDELGG
jgi:predicted nucleotidyltransferase